MADSSRDPQRCRRSNCTHLALPGLRMCARCALRTRLSMRKAKGFEEGEHGVAGRPVSYTDDELRKLAAQQPLLKRGRKPKAEKKETT